LIDLFLVGDFENMMTSRKDLIINQFFPFQYISFILHLSLYFKPRAFDQMKAIIKSMVIKGKSEAFYRFVVLFFFLSLIKIRDMRMKLLVFFGVYYFYLLGGRKSVECLRSLKMASIKEGKERILGFNSYLREIKEEFNDENSPFFAFWSKIVDNTLSLISFSDDLNSNGF